MNNKLRIVIPALDEEDSIKSIIERCLDARSAIIENTFIDTVDVTVVSDGSTDNTIPFAQEYTDEIKLIIFEKNKGYGAAIKDGWRQSDAEYLSFLDADGTCNPLFFIELAKLMERENADIVLGSRLNENSEMPAIRRLGNTIFATLLSIFASNKIKDTASGMRIVKRSALDRIMPLPDGLHFTPAMSARAVLSDDLRIAEMDMPYKEREGESKLSVVKDGIRFLKIILGTAFLYRPNIMLNLFSLFALLVAVLLMIKPTSFYLGNSFVEEWMIYRFILASFAITASALAFVGSGISERIVNMTLFNKTDEKKYSLVYRFLASKFAWVLIIGFAVVGLWFTYQSFIERLTTGETTEHWSRYIAMLTFLTLSTVLLTFKVTSFFLSKVGDRLNYLRDEEKQVFAYTDKKNINV